MTVVTVAVPLANWRPSAGSKAVETWSAEELKAASDYAKRYIERLDANGDGVVTRGEMPKSVPYSVFRRMSENDEFLTNEDVKRQYLQRL